MTARPRRDKRTHVFVEDLENPQLSDDDLHHLQRALRLRPGDPITICDGAYAWRTALFESSPAITGDIVRVSPPSPATNYRLRCTKR